MQTASISAWIGLGANIGNDPQQALRDALAALAHTPGCRLCAQSSLYRSAPIGSDAAQPDYINAVARLDTTLSAPALLAALLAIEQQFGRTRSVANAPRTLDLDLLLYGDSQISLPALSVPHPRMHERAFVLAPLAQLDPALHIPGHGQVGPLLAALPAQDISRLDEQP